MEQIQKETKIRTKYLTAIENGDFSVIPGGDVYIKGFLKNYADTIGLDSGVVIELYKKVTGKEKEEEETDSAVSLTQDSAKVDDLSGKPKHKIVSIAVLLIIFLILAVTFIKAFKPKNSQHETKPPMSQSLPEDETNKSDVEDTTHSIEDLNDVVDTKDTKDTEVIIEVVEDSKQQTVYVIDDDFVEVTMNVIDGRCWISVMKDDIVDFEGTLNTGETKTWRAEKDVNIRIGNPPVINLVINGKDFGRPAGEARNFIFKRRT